MAWEESERGIYCYMLLYLHYFDHHLYKYNIYLFILKSPKGKMFYCAFIFMGFMKSHYNNSYYYYTTNYF